ncbi:response regulator [Stenotrophomonas geniculata]|uniref:response regulator n=1 Tax=Stenotrophomonas geniculata TaxID=86188 RepID=UPI001F3D213C
MADDHPVIRLGVEAALDETPMIECVGSVANSTALLELLDSTPCDVLVTDYAMPGGRHGDGLALIGLLSKRYPELPIIVLTGLDQPGLLQALHSAGVQHLLSKADDLQHVSSAVLAAHARRRYLSPSINDLLPKRGSSRPARPLSTKEREVLRLYVSGMGINEIAAHLDRRKQTISTQKVSGMAKLGVDKDADLFKLAEELGLRGASDID